jgi:Flp pilus assembly protein TadG
LLGRDRRGVAALEFALTGIPVLILLLATVEFGRLLADQYALSLGVERAARFAVVHGSQSTLPASGSDISAAFYAAAAPFLGTTTSGVVVTVSFAPDNSPGSMVTVSARYAFMPVTALEAIPALTLSAAASYTIQN